MVVGGFAVVFDIVALVLVLVIVVLVADAVAVLLLSFVVVRSL